MKRHEDGKPIVDKMADSLKGYDFEIIHTNVPAEQEADLRAAFADAES